MISGKLLLVGCGKMGGALLDGWMAQGVEPSNVAIVEPGDHHGRSDIHVPKGVTVVSSPDRLPEAFRPAFVLMAVKPQVIGDVLGAYQGYADQGAVFVSVAAGKDLSFLTSILGQAAHVIRAMPNTPAAVERGMTGLCATDNVPVSVREDCRLLFSAVGQVAWLEDESLIDAVTAVSGAGPAYVFHMVEALASAGAEAGLPKNLSMQLARQTVCGAGELLFQSPLSAAELRRNVTSPGGVTQAGLSVLMQEGQCLTDLLRQSVAAAAKRSRELRS